MMHPEKLKVLFVCLGNICRSPLGEGVFRHLVAAAGLADRFDIDSAGTSSYHIGDPPDERTTSVARARGVVLTGAARQVRARDLDDFDYVLAMDEQNLRNIRKLAGGSTRAEIRLLREFDPQANGDLDVPDPYYGGARGFENVHDIVERSCIELLRHIREQHGL
jgi:protein-tyrosine phosphatase